MKIRTGDRPVSPVSGAEKLESHMQKKLDHNLTPYTKTQNGSETNVRPQTIKPLEENGGKTPGHGSGQRLFESDTKGKKGTQTSKGTTSK